MMLLLLLRVGAVKSSRMRAATFFFAALSYRTEL